MRFRPLLTVSARLTAYGSSDTCSVVHSQNEAIGAARSMERRESTTSQHYRLNLVTEDSGKTVTAITWQKVPVPGAMTTHPGVHCLRTDGLAWYEEKLWRTYTMLTDLEGMFRSLKSELGLRPIHQHKKVRSEEHLFITMLALPVRSVPARETQGRGNHGQLDDSAGHPLRTRPGHRDLQSA